MKKKVNSYDAYIDNLTLEFSNIKNFHLLTEDEKGKKLFNFIVLRLAEIHSFKILFSSYYIPSAAKSAADALIEISKSKYKNFLSLTKEDLKENYYETVRLGYVGMFHKYESYIAELVKYTDLLFNSDEEFGSSIADYSIKKFQYRINDWKNSFTVSRINWISNCNKHYDGYPLKQPKNIMYLHIPDNEKLKLTKEDFIRDIDALIKLYTISMQNIFTIANYRMVFESSLFYSKDVDSKSEEFLKSIQDLIAISKTF